MRWQLSQRIVDPTLQRVFHAEPHVEARHSRGVRATALCLQDYSVHPGSMTDETIVRVLQGRASDIEERQVLEWRGASLDNARRFRELAEIWALTGSVRADVGEIEPPDPDAIRARARGRRLVFSSDRMRWRGSVIAASAAAAVIVIAAMSARYLRRDAAERPDRVAFVTRELTTNASEMVTVRLDDGTIVRLGPESRLRFGGPSYGEREVSLDGKAYFAVARDSARPFRVHTNSGEVRVLGTRFELSADNEALNLTVIQGLVEVNGGARHVRVGAGEASHLTKGGIPVVLPVTDAFAGVDRWVGQVLFFEATPLDQVAHELSEHYGMHVRLADTTLARRTITASFINRSFEAVLTVVCRVADVHCDSSGDTVTVSR